MPKQLHLAGINYESFVDGEGVRAAIFFSGCSHNCPQCHNPQAQDPSYGTPITPELIKEIADEINKRPFLSGITLTGGDPLFDATATCHFMSLLQKHLHKKHNVWLYTGATFEQCKQLPIMKYVDVVVDGEFVPSLANRSLVFRGSSNQRIIDVKLSTELGDTVIVDTECIWDT